MTLRSRVEKIVTEMEGGNLQTIVDTVKDRALKELLQILPAKIEELFIQRAKEVDNIIKERVDAHLGGKQDGKEE